MRKRKVSVADRVAEEVLRRFPVAFTPGQHEILSLAIRQGVEMGEAIRRHRACR